VDNRDLHAPQGQSVRGLKPQQASSDHHRAATPFGRLQHLVDIVEVAEGNDTRKVVPRHRDDEGITACRNQQPVVWLDPA